MFYTYPYYIFPCFKMIRPRIYLEPRCYSGTFRPDARNTSRGSHTGHQMSQGAEKSQPPEVGIEPGPQDLEPITLTRRCISGLLPQGSRSVFYTYPYYKGKCTEACFFSSCSFFSIILLQKSIQPYIPYIHTLAPLNNTFPDSLDPVVHICFVKKKIRKGGPFAQTTLKNMLVFINSKDIYCCTNQE